MLPADLRSTLNLERMIVDGKVKVYNPQDWGIMPCTYKNQVVIMIDMGNDEMIYLPITRGDLKFIKKEFEGCVRILKNLPQMEEFNEAVSH